MKTLWFKQCFVADILDGTKTDTMRRPSTRLPTKGEIVRLSVGPRPAFARARIIAIDSIRLRDLSARRRAQVIACYGDGTSELVRIRFRTVTTTAQYRSQPSAESQQA